MTTAALTELDLFQLYIADQCGANQCGSGLNGHTLEEAVADFREYQRQLTEVRAKVQAAIESSERGESRTLTDEDLQAKFARLDAKLRTEGITG